MKPNRRRELIRDPHVFEEATRMNSLVAAWQKVWKNAGAAGPDAVTVEKFQAGVTGRLRDLQDELSRGAYTPGGLRRVEIPKPDGGVRPLDIPTVRDRVVQTALAQSLGRRLDTEFEDSSFAYRTGRSVQQAVRRVSALRNEGLSYVVDADIKRYFERIPHDALMTRLSQSMTAGAASELIGLWLETWFSDGRGLAQGSPISPLLANLFLDRLDEAMMEKGARIVRFADDFVILCRSEKGAEEALARTQRLLAGQGLELNMEKTRITSFDEGFRFLGQVFVRSFVLADPENDIHEAERLMQALARQDADETARREREDDRIERARDAGLDPGQRVIYMTTPRRRLSTTGAAFSVLDVGRADSGEDGVREILRVPDTQVDRIELGPGVDVNAEALRHALGSETLVSFVNGHGETLGWASPTLAPRAGRQFAQAKAALDPQRRLEFARAFVEGRLRNQRAHLRRLNRNRNDPAIIKPLEQINQMIRRLPHCPAIDVVMGVEGRAAALYWPALGLCIDGGFRFRLRRRQPATDPVNIMLNVTSSFLLRDAGAAVLRAGLHPGFGFLHGTADYRDALVYDLAEEFRVALSESPVVAAVNQRGLNRDMFSDTGNGVVRMSSTGLRCLIREYERAAGRELRDPISGHRRTWRAMISDQAVRLARAIEDGGLYTPVTMDY